MFPETYKYNSSCFMTTGNSWKSGPSYIWKYSKYHLSKYMESTVYPVNCGIS